MDRQAAKTARYFNWKTARPVGAGSRMRRKLGLAAQGLRQRGHYAILLLRGHLVEQRQNHGMVLRGFAFYQRSRGAVLAAPVGGLAVRAHDAAAGRDAVIQQVLHHGGLVASLRKADEVALPVTARLGGLAGRDDRAYDAEQLVVTRGQLAAARHNFRQTLELLPANRGLNIGHAVVE